MAYGDCNRCRKTAELTVSVTERPRQSLRLCGLAGRDEFLGRGYVGIGWVPNRWPGSLNVGSLLAKGNGKICR
jgi:hypothetical protein